EDILGVRTMPGKKCFPAKTQIEVFDGAKKCIKDIQVGEKIACVDYRNGAISEGIVDKVVQGEVGHLIQLNSRICGSPEQTIITNKGRMTFKDIKVGDLIFEYPSLS